MAARNAVLSAVLVGVAVAPASPYGGCISSQASWSVQAPHRGGPGRNVARLYGGAIGLPLWSFPTDDLCAGARARDDEDSVQMLGSTSVAKLHEWDDADTQNGDAGRADRHQQLEAARVHWWNGDVESADCAFLKALSWYRSSTNVSTVPASDVCRNGHHATSGSGLDNAVTPDGTLRWQRAKPLSNHGHTIEEANAICEYAAFLFKELSEIDAAGSPARPFLAGVAVFYE